METLAGDTKKLIEDIMQQIGSVTRSPAVTQGMDGLHNVQKDSKKGVVTHGK